MQQLHQNFEKSTQPTDTDNYAQDNENTSNTNEENTTNQITNFLQDAEVQSLAQNGLPRVIKIKQQNQQTQQQPSYFYPLPIKIFSFNLLTFCPSYNTIIVFVFHLCSFKMVDTVELLCQETAMLSYLYVLVYTPYHKSFG